jgi:Transposase
MTSVCTGAVSPLISGTREPRGIPDCCCEHGLRLWVMGLPGRRWPSREEDGWTGSSSGSLGWMCTRPRSRRACECPRSDLESATARPAPFGPRPRGWCCWGTGWPATRSRWWGWSRPGCCWKPVEDLLEDEFPCWLLNARHLRNVAGHKTDVADAAWICQLVEHGLVRPSFVPPKPIRQLRDLTRYRKALIHERTRETEAAGQGAGGCRHQAGLGGQLRPWASRAGRCWRRWWLGRPTPGPGRAGPRAAPQAGCRRCARR